jgi:hypothetical protein
MKELTKKYGYYYFADGSLYIEVSDKELVRPNLKDIVINFSNNIIKLKETKELHIKSSVWTLKILDDTK